MQLLTFVLASGACKEACTSSEVKPLNSVIFNKRGNDWILFNLTWPQCTVTLKKCEMKQRKKYVMVITIVDKK